MSKQKKNSQCENIEVLQDFLENHGLLGSSGNFQANVIFIPESGEESELDVEVGISFLGQGKNEGSVSFFGNDIPFPVSYLAGYQDFKCRNNQLVITGKHPKIGEYEVIITPK